MAITNMKELCEYVKQKRKTRKLQHIETIKSMVRVEVWVIEDTSYRKNLRFHNNISILVIKCGEVIMKSMI